MITLRRAKERQHQRHRKQETWLTFSPHDLASPLVDGFGTLEILTEDRLLPGAGVPRRPHNHAEIVTYVREGALAYEDSMGRSNVIHASEFQRMTPGRGIHHSQTNASRTDDAHVFQIGLRPWEADLDSGQEQKRFSAAQRRGGLCVVASPDARKGSLRIHQDALMYSAMLDPGQHLVQGEVSIGDLVLTAGDGVGISAERAVSLTAREEAEILLVDLGAERPGPS